ncbi:cytochrome-c peroxidase [Nitrospiraceae bacterium AH_259_D15_M11_P09]|nr:cytochrome-c peroxidase [Nitrospiraceae bacterium AH_259_D15_M11_P09]
MNMRRIKRLGIGLGAIGVILAGTLALSTTAPAGQDAYPALGPLPAIKVNPEEVELGRLLFFDNRYTGDAAESCASCHDPKKAYGDGKQLSNGYPGTAHYRNAPTLLNSAHQYEQFWVGAHNNCETTARWHLVNQLFMNADGRYLEERTRQIPEYYERFQKLYGIKRTIYFGKISKAMCGFVNSLVSDPKNVPFDRYTMGDKSALTPLQIKGLQVFKGKAKCIRCHNGPLLSDKKYHNVGVPQHPELSTNPTRQIGLRWDNMFLGVPNWETRIDDPGVYQYSKDKRDLGKFRTGTLRELKYTAPYMHNGTLPTLKDVVEFYDRGGGPHPNKDPLIKPLGLTMANKKALVAFLESLSSDEMPYADARPEKYGEEGIPYTVYDPFVTWVPKDPGHPVLH